MAVVHELLAGSDEERSTSRGRAHRRRTGAARAARRAKQRVRREGEGSTGQVDAHIATSLALALAELVHNAIEHGFAERRDRSGRVAMRRVPGELIMTVRDDGVGLPADFDARTSANLGLEIVRTVVEDDLRGTLSFSVGRGTTVTVRVPVKDRSIDSDGRTRRRCA